MEWTKAEIVLATLAQFDEAADVFDDVSRIANLVYFVLRNAQKSWPVS